MEEHSPSIFLQLSSKSLLVAKQSAPQLHRPGLLGNSWLFQGQMWFIIHAWHSGFPPLQFGWRSWSDPEPPYLTSFSAKEPCFSFFPDVPILHKAAAARKKTKTNVLSATWLSRRAYGGRSLDAHVWLFKSKRPVELCGALIYTERWVFRNVSQPEIVMLHPN